MSDMNVTLGKFNESFNFIFGLSSLPPDFDVMNNPFVEFAGDEYRDLLLERKHENDVDRCEQQFVDSFLTTSAQRYYAQPLCLKHRD